MKRFPECRRSDCAFAEGPTSTTLMVWTPLYNKRGKLLNADPNTQATEIICHTCEQKWTRKTINGKTTFL